MLSASFALQVGLLTFCVFHSGMAMPSIFDEFGPTPRTYDASGHLHKNYHNSNKYDNPYLSYPELDYGKASAIHNPSGKNNAGPPVYYAHQAPSPVTPSPYGDYGPSPTPLSYLDSYVAESSIHHPVNDYVHQSHHVPASLYAPANVYHTTPHPYKAEGEAQIDVHSSPDGFSYQVTEERGRGSYSHVSQTRDFSKKVPAYKHNKPAPGPYHPRELAYSAPAHASQQAYHSPYPSPHHPSAYLDPLPSPSPYDEPIYDHPIGGHHNSYNKHHGPKPRTYAANGHTSPGTSASSKQHNHYGKKSSGYKATPSHGVRSYVVV